ncbi:hypothetical protein CLOP_g13679 [Closterium sp. NIES-67]|nr:hypothetical protein CLOP_g13679 [Closterium sp. NIES-67]
MVGPLALHRSGLHQTEPSSVVPPSLSIEIAWGLGNELLICAPAASVAASDGATGGAVPGRSDGRPNDVAGRGSAVVSVTWADTSSFHRQIAAGASSLYERLHAAISTAEDAAEDAEEADHRRDRWRHVSRWSRHVSRLLSPPDSQSTLAAARASPHSLGISAADPFAGIDAEEEGEEEEELAPRGISQGELAAVWDLLRLCFLPDETPGTAADVDSGMDICTGADVDSGGSGVRGGDRGGAAGGRGGSAYSTSSASAFPLLLPPPSPASSAPTCQPLLSWLAQYNASLPPLNASTSACLRSLRDQMSQSEAIPPEDLEPYWPAVASCAAIGWRDTATALLRMHSSYREDQVIQREAENGLVEAVAVLLSEMPMPLEPMAARDAAEVAAYHRHRDHWRNRLARLKATPFWAAADAPATERGLLALLDLLLGSSHAVDDVARSHWLELLAARLLHQNPQATASAQASLALHCWREAAGSSGKATGSSHPLDASDLVQPSLDRLLLASLCRETEVVVSIASRILPPWFLVQVIELLSLHSPSLSALPAKQAAAAAARNAASAAHVPSAADAADINSLSVLDLCRVNYAMDLLSEAATWQLALPYLSPCPPAEPFIEQVLLSQPVTASTHSSISKALFLVETYAPACYPSAAAFFSRSAAMACWDSRSVVTSRHVASVYWMAAAGPPASAPMDALVLFLADELLVPAIRGRWHLVRGAPGPGTGADQQGSAANFSAAAAAVLDALSSSSGSTGQSHPSLEYMLSIWELVKQLTGAPDTRASPFFPAAPAPEPIQRSHLADRLVQALLHTSSHYPRVFLALSHLLAHALERRSLPFKEAHISALISCLQQLCSDTLSQEHYVLKKARGSADTGSEGLEGVALWDHLDTLKLALAKELSAKILFL